MAAFHARKSGFEGFDLKILRKPQKCLCCDEDIAKGEQAYRTKRDITLCILCMGDWKKLLGKIVDLPRFKRG